MRQVVVLFKRCVPATLTQALSVGACGQATAADIGNVRVSESEGVLLLYLLAGATALAGLFQLPFWTALIGGTAIGLVGISEQLSLRPRFVAVGSEELLTTAHLLSLAAGLVAGLAAWVLGAFSAWAYWA